MQKTDAEVTRSQLDVLAVYHLVMTNIAMERSTMLLIGKPSINGPLSMAMLHNQRVKKT
jgi:hypothetical protein